MEASTQIRSILGRLPAGSKVRLELADGQTVEGQVKGMNGDTLAMRNADGVEADQVRDVIVIRKTDGPE
jgi:hypothetical protein